jgi:hypothetical protein
MYDKYLDYKYSNKYITYGLGTNIHYLLSNIQKLVIRNIIDNKEDLYFYKYLTKYHKDESEYFNIVTIPPIWKRVVEFMNEQRIGGLNFTVSAQMREMLFKGK